LLKRTKLWCGFIKERRYCFELEQWARQVDYDFDGESVQTLI
jgi:hypothetical protein